MFQKYYEVLLLICFVCTALVQCLSDEDYDRMPALFSFDNYDSCLDEKDGVYCVLNADLIAAPDNELMGLIKEYSKVTHKHYNHSYVQRGLCVKETCNNFVKDNRLSEIEDLTHVLRECLNATMLRNYGLQSKISQVHYCNTKDDKSEIDLLDWCIAGVFLAIVLINIIGTLYDYNRNEKDRGNKYLLSFSVIQNWEWLVNTEFEDPKLRRLKGLCGIRTLINLLVVFAHTSFLFANVMTERPHDYEKIYDKYPVFFNGPIIIQVFFQMSGFLLTYNYLVRAESLSNFTWTRIPVAIFLRWWRLTPALAVVIAFSMTWLRHLGSGPLWNLYVAKSVVSHCRKYWWSNLFYFNNYLTENKFCALHTWSNASDSQLFLVGLITLIATVSRGRRVVLTLLLVLSLILPAFHVWLHDLEPITLFTPETWRGLNNDTFFYLHGYGHNHMTSYVVGMATAILVYNWQNKGVNITESKICKILLWLVIPGLITVIYIPTLFYTGRERSPLALRMVFQPLHRLIISLIIAFWFVCTTMKCKATLNYLVEWRGWVVPSRLTYSVYLLHFNILYILAGVNHNLVAMSFWYFIIYFLGITMFSYIISVPFFLIVEAPLNRLMKNITSRTTRPLKNNEDSKV